MFDGEIWLREISLMIEWVYGVCWMMEYLEFVGWRNLWEDRICWITECIGWWNLLDDGICWMIKFIECWNLLGDKVCWWNLLDDGICWMMEFLRALKKILKNTTKVYRRVVFLRTFLYFIENPPKYIKCTELYNSCTANTRVV